MLKLDKNTQMGGGGGGGGNSTFCVKVSGEWKKMCQGGLV